LPANDVDRVHDIEPHDVPISLDIGMSPQMTPQIHVDRGGRNAYLGPDYATTDLRITRRLYLRPRYKLELVVEAFDVMNRDSQRIIITDDGVNSTGSYFLRLDKTIGIRYFPAC
jgi:hypothetical protein